MSHRLETGVVMEVIGVDREICWDGQALVAKRTGVAGVTLAGCAQGDWAVNESNAPVPQVDQVRDSLTGSFLVGNGGQIDLQPVGDARHGYQSNARIQNGLIVGTRLAACGEKYPGDMFGSQRG